MFYTCLLFAGGNAIGFAERGIGADKRVFSRNAVLGDVIAERLLGGDEVGLLLAQVEACRGLVVLAGGLQFGQLVGQAVEVLGDAGALRLESFGQGGHFSAQRLGDFADGVNARAGLVADGCGRLEALGCGFEFGLLRLHFGLQTQAFDAFRLGEVGLLLQLLHLGKHGVESRQRAQVAACPAGSSIGSLAAVGAQLDANQPLVLLRRCLAGKLRVEQLQRRVQVGFGDDVAVFISVLHRRAHARSVVQESCLSRAETGDEVGDGHGLFFRDLVFFCGFTARQRRHAVPRQNICRDAEAT